MGVAGICDTGCPSGSELMAFKVMFWTGLVAAAFALTWLIALALRKSRR